MRLSQFANRSFVPFWVFACGVAVIPVAGEGNGPRFVFGVAWKGLVGLAPGLSSSAGLLCIGVRGAGVWFAYLGGGVLGGTFWGMGGRFGMGVGGVRGKSAILAMLGVSPVARVRRAATSA